MAELFFGWAKAEYLWVFFVIFAAVNFCSSIYMVKYLSAIKKRTKMSAAIAGAAILSMISSLPEIVSAITAGLIGISEVSIGNLMGANLFSGVMLVVVDLIFIRYLFFSKINRSNRVMIYIMIVVNLILVLTFLPVSAFDFMRITIPYLNISWVFLLLFIFYFVFLFFVFKGFGDVDAEPKTKKDIGLKHFSLKLIIILFVIFAVILVISSILLVTVIDNFEKVYGIKKDSAGAIFLGMTTAMPEVISLFILCRIGFGNVAFAGIFGSHFFNSVIYLITDAFDYRGGSLQRIQNGNVNNLISLFILAVFLAGTMIIFGLKTWKKISNNKVGIIVTSSGVIVLYIASIIIPILYNQRIF